MRRLKSFVFLNIRNHTHTLRATAQKVEVNPEILGPQRPQVAFEGHQKMFPPQLFEQLPLRWVCELLVIFT